MQAGQGGEIALKTRARFCDCGRNRAGRAEISTSGPSVTEILPTGLRCLYFEHKILPLGSLSGKSLAYVPADTVTEMSSKSEPQQQWLLAKRKSNLSPACNMDELALHGIGREDDNCGSVQT